MLPYKELHTASLTNGPSIKAPTLFRATAHSQCHEVSQLYTPVATDGTRCFSHRSARASGSDKPAVARKHRSSRGLGNKQRNMCDDGIAGMPIDMDPFDLMGPTISAPEDASPASVGIDDTYRCLYEGNESRGSVSAPGGTRNEGAQACNGAQEDVILHGEHDDDDNVSDLEAALFGDDVVQVSCLTPTLSPSSSPYRSTIPDLVTIPGSAPVSASVLSSPAAPALSPAAAPVLLSASSLASRACHDTAYRDRCGSCTHRG